MKDKKDLCKEDFPILATIGDYPQDFIMFKSPKDVSGNNFKILETKFQNVEMFDLLKKIYEIAWQNGYNKAEQNRRWEKDGFRFNGG
jgi:hypothetical protein